MALIFPDEGSRLAYRLVGGRLEGAVGAEVKVYTDLAATQLFATLTVDSQSLIPIFFGPNGTQDILYVKVSNGPVKAIFAQSASLADLTPAGVDPLAALRNGTSIGASRIQNGSIVVEFTSQWGITPGGTPYWNVNGAAPADAAIFTLASDGTPVVIRPLGVTP